MKQKIFLTVKYVFLIMVLLIVVIPMLFIFMSSFKSETEIFSNPWALPTTISFARYVDIFLNYNMGDYFKNSLFYSIVGCLICLAVTIPAGYAIRRMHWKLSKFTMMYLVSGLMIPIHAIMVPLYISVNTMGLPNRFALLMIYVSSAVPTALYLITGSLETIPVSIEEAAIIDGCSIPKVLTSVVLPISKPIMATVCIFSFLTIWNDLMLSLIFLSNEKDKTVQVGIMRFKDTYFTDYGALLSAIVVAILPTLIIFLFLSDKIVEGMTAGAVKE